jgi:hypothetical protein
VREQQAVSPVLRVKARRHAASFHKRPAL